MNNDFVFSWAENAVGKMVHVDDVPRGLQCNCTCPNCHEKLMARHGDIREHGFAHHSDNRGANLKICYMVILYKLAEQIIQTHKKILAPSYYGIFPQKVLEFVDVKIDSRYEREDKQPDVIANTSDGKQYLIEFTFDYKVQHKKAIDYKNLNCLEINLSGQTLESVEKFLLEDTSDRKWLNNQDYFENIVHRYKTANKVIELKDEKDCQTCELRLSCTGARQSNSYALLVIENSGKRYRICKTEQFSQQLEALHQRQKEQEEIRKREQERLRQYEQKRKPEPIRSEYEEAKRQEEYRSFYEEEQEEKRLKETNIPSFDPNEKTCFVCECNLSWMNNRNPGYANCGCYITMRVPQKTPPQMALTCRGFKRKN